MSVMNRPDGGPQPRHAIEAEGASWTDAGRQVVSGAFRIVAARRTICSRSSGSRTTSGSRSATSGGSSTCARRWPTPSSRYERGELDIVTVRYTPRLADVVPSVRDDAHVGPAAWSGYFGFDHAHPVLSNVDFRRALAHAVDRRCARDAWSRTTWWSRPAASSRPRSRATRRTSSCGSIRTRLARTSTRAASLERSVTIAGIETWVGNVPRDRRGPRGMTSSGLDVAGGVVDPRASADAHEPPRDRADRVHRLAARLRRPRVLPAAALPVGQQDERGRVLDIRRSTT